jgi:glycine/D-amino acid oxidase-like deaminating enzyme/nitrite reductase/ring-hydroxylating ferredoxin subunit
VIERLSEAPVSPWFDRAPAAPRQPLGEDVRVDVAIVGAGIIGLSTALALQRAGIRAIVLEAREVAAAASGNNTAKLSALQGLAYSKLAHVGAEPSAAYAGANKQGLELIAGLVRELSIDCAFRRVPNFTYAEHAGDLGAIEREHEACLAAGLDTSFVEDTPLPFPIAGAVRLDGQARFDPVVFLRALADELDRKDQTVFERSRVVGVDEGSVTTADGATVSCDHVVLATHLPIHDRVGLFARMEPMASFATTARLEAAPPDGMYMDVQQAHSLRSVKLGDESLMIVGGQGHRLGSGDAAKSIRALQAYARVRLGATGFRHHWDAHDLVTEDRLPFVGPTRPLSSRVLTATGMNKWGLALGAACGEMLAKTISDGHAAWPEPFDTRRVPRARSVPTLASNGVKTAVHLGGDRLKRGSADALGPGEGAIVRSGLGQHAAYRDEAGRLHELSARCTHLGCIVAFNDSAKTWDCPCHGSRFALDGPVLEGPAVNPLERTV